MGVLTGDEVVVAVLGGEEAGAIAGDVGLLYRASFGAAPNSEGPEQFDHQRASFDELRGRRGFRLSVARLAGGLVGFAYGAFLLPETRWWNGMCEPLPEEMTAETGDRTFSLVDMGVLPEHRRRGIGRALHDAVLRGCGAERATLAVEPRLESNQWLYQSWGWRCAGRLAGAPGDIADAYDIYVLDVLPTGNP